MKQYVYATPINDNGKEKIALVILVPGNQNEIIVGDTIIYTLSDYDVYPVRVKVELNEVILASPVNP